MNFNAAAIHVALPKTEAGEDARTSGPGSGSSGKGGDGKKNSGDLGAKVPWTIAVMAVVAAVSTLL